MRRKRALVAAEALERRRLLASNLVNDANLDGQNSYVDGRRMPESGSNAYFYAATRDYGDELWMTDGTSAGTRIVKDISPGPGNAVHSSTITSIGGGIVVFVASDGVHGHEWWRTDGTEAGTYMLRDIYPGAGDSFNFKGYG